MADDYQRLLGEIANLKRQMGNLIRPVTVKEAKGGRVRPLLGKDNDGKEVLGPWLHTGNMRGGAREGRFYKEGQNLMMISPTGDPGQAVLMPYAPNNSHKRPSHASESGQDEETYQQDALRVKKTKDGYSIWLQDEEQQQDQQQQGQQQGGAGADKNAKATPAQQHKQQKPDGKVVIRLHKDGGVEARVKSGDDVYRFKATKDGVKMKAGSTWAVVQKGKLLCSQPWEVQGTDPMTDDDKTDV